MWYLLCMTLSHLVRIKTISKTCLCSSLSLPPWPSSNLTLLNSRLIATWIKQGESFQILEGIQTFWKTHKIKKNLSDLNNFLFSQKCIKYIYKWVKTIHINYIYIGGEAKCGMGDCNRSNSFSNKCLWITLIFLLFSNMLSHPWLSQISLQSDAPLVLDCISPGLHSPLHKSFRKPTI